MAETTDDILNALSQSVGGDAPTGGAASAPPAAGKGKNQTPPPAPAAPKAQRGAATSWYHFVDTVMFNKVKYEAGANLQLTQEDADALGALVVEGMLEDAEVDADEFVDGLYRVTEHAGQMGTIRNGVHVTLSVGDTLRLTAAEARKLFPGVEPA